MRTVYTLGLLLFLLSCKNEEKKPVELPDDHAQPLKDEQVEKKVETVTEEDAFFLTFMEKFMLDPQFQKSRVLFPIVIGDEEINKEKWKNSNYYSGKEFFPFLLPKELSFESGAIISDSLTIDFFDYATMNLVSYDFVKKEKIWQLDKVTFPNPDNIKENQFLSFLIQFSQDIDYQRNHIFFPIQEIVLKYENDNLEETETAIPIEEWEFFSLMKEIGSLIIVNGHEPDAIQKTIYLRGIENGISIEYHFEKIKGEWKFVKIEDHST